MIDLHTHTRPTSGCAQMTAEELIEAAMAAGLDAIAVTDHWLIEGAERAQRIGRRKYGFTVLRGVEAQSAGMGDVLVFGCYRDFRPMIPWTELRRLVDEDGGALVLAHPFRRRDANSLWAHLRDRGLAPDAGLGRHGWLQGLAAVETLNSANEPAENAEAQALARALALPACGGSDAHWTARVGRAATWFPGTVSTDAELVAALKEGGFRPVDRPNGRGKDGL